jgi:hypothetical protein
MNNPMRLVDPSGYATLSSVEDTSFAGGVEVIIVTGQMSGFSSGSLSGLSVTFGTGGSPIYANLLIPSLDLTALPSLDQINADKEDANPSEESTPDENVEEIVVVGQQANSDVQEDSLEWIEWVGWGLIVIDFLDTPILPGPDISVVGAVMVKAARVAKSAGKLSKVEKSKTVEKIGKKFTKTTEVRPGKGSGQSRAEYVRYKNEDGKVIRTYKDSYDQAGNWQHRKALRGGPEGRPRED